ncbi:MAG TPA: ecotin precursor, partial [Caballeronia sp.]|nr:ecotin precursor [Caballeronia sp.]
VYAQPVYQPVYAQPVYAQPAYAQPGPPPGYCFDDYRRAYVPCGAEPQAGYYQQQGW